jgi:hypothetical protein
MSNYKDKGWYFGVRRPISGAEYRRLVKTHWPGKLRIEAAGRAFDAKHFRPLPAPGRPFLRRRGWLDRVRARRWAALVDGIGYHTKEG